MKHIGVTSFGRSFHHLALSVWRLLSSIRLALLLILLLATVVLLGTLIVQAPSSALATPEAFQSWLQRVRERYGVGTDVLATLSLFNVYSSIWFRALVLLLMANVVVCTIDRSQRLWKTVLRPRVVTNADVLLRAELKCGLSTPLPLHQSVVFVETNLRSRRYRVIKEVDGDSVCLYADRNHLARLGTLLNHAGLVFVLLGVMIGSVWGFHEDSVIVSEGKSYAVGHGTDLVIRVDRFIDEYHPDGRPKDYYSDVVLYEGEREVGHHRLRVNDPLSYRGVTFYQSFFGNAVVLRVQDHRGEVVFDDPVPLAWSYHDQPLGIFELPSRDLSVVTMWTAGLAVDAPDLMLHAYRSSTGEVVSAAALNQGPEGGALLGDLHFSFSGVRRYTGLQVTSDPGLPVIWSACTVMLLGTVLVFYLPHRRLRLRFTSVEDGTRLLVAGFSKRDVGFEREFGQLVDAISLAVAPKNQEVLSLAARPSVEERMLNGR